MRAALAFAAAPENVGKGPLVIMGAGRARGP
jgi:hypothetical protein